MNCAFCLRVERGRRDASAAPAAAAASPTWTAGGWPPQCGADDEAGVCACASLRAVTPAAMKVASALVPAFGGRQVRLGAAAAAGRGQPSGAGGGRRAAPPVTPVPSSSERQLLQPRTTKPERHVLRVRGAFASGVEHPLAGCCHARRPGLLASPPPGGHRRRSRAPYRSRCHPCACVCVCTGGGGIRRS